MPILILGYSDDLVDVQGHINGTNIACGNQFVEITLGDETGGVVITMTYGLAGVGVWAATLRQIDEAVPIPWSIHITHAPANGYPRPGNNVGYSVLVQVDAPSDVPYGVKKTYTRSTVGRPL